MASSLPSTAGSASPHASLLRTQRTLLQSLEHITQERDELYKQIEQLKGSQLDLSDAKVCKLSASLLNLPHAFC